MWYYRVVLILIRHVCDDSECDGRNAWGLQLRIDYLLQLFLMLLTTGIKIDPCQYPGSKYPDQNNKLTNHSGDCAHDRDQN